VATKTGKQGPELVSRVAELEAENAGQARQVEELRVALDEVQQQAREKILEEKRKAKQVGGTVEELTQTLSSALDELKVRVMERGRSKANLHGTRRRKRSWREPSSARAAEVEGEVEPREAERREAARSWPRPRPSSKRR
jgi:hypothetical protein